MKNITIYTGRTCGPCRQLKLELFKRGVAYDEKPVEQHMEEFLALGEGRQVPVTIVGDKVFRGFVLEEIIAEAEEGV